MDAATAQEARPAIAAPRGELAVADLPLARIPTQARSREKVLRALAAAERIVTTEGVDAITLPRVAAAADVSVGALYQYLPDREAITAAIVARYHARLEALLDAVIEAAPQIHPEDPVRYVLDAVAEVYQDEAAARSLRGAAGVVGPGADAARAHKERMGDKVRLLLVVVGALDDGPTSAVVARVAFTAADAVLHDAFALDASERAAVLAELERVLRLAVAPAG